MSDSDVYLPSASSTESFEEEEEVANTIQLYEGKPRASYENFDVD